MSKLTARDYKSMAKRPTKRGYGRAVLRNVPEMEEVTVEEALDIVDEAEMDLAELVDGEAEIEVPTAEAVEDTQIRGYEVPVIPLGSINGENRPASLGSIDG